MTLTLAELYLSPDHYLHSFDGDAAVFVPMDRAAYHRSLFLDGRISPAAQGAMRVPVAALAEAIATPSPTGWIMHVAHCGSTLLARALDHVAANLVLREPLALRQLAFSPPDNRLMIATTMLSKRYQPDLPTIVKGNVPINFLLPQIAASDPGARMILLHLPLRDYLVAILRSDNHREWLRRVTTQLAPHLGEMRHATDVERASALWLAQTRIYAAAVEILPDARSLDGERFFAAPGSVLRAAADHFQVPLSQTEIARSVAGPLFATYSKNPAISFDNAKRLARRRQVETALASELEHARRCIDGTLARAAGALNILTATALTA